MFIVNSQKEKKSLLCNVFSLHTVFLNQAIYGIRWQGWMHLESDKFQIDSHEGCNYCNLSFLQ